MKTHPQPLPVKEGRSWRIVSFRRSFEFTFSLFRYVDMSLCCFLLYIELQHLLVLEPSFQMIVDVDGSYAYRRSRVDEVTGL